MKAHERKVRKAKAKFNPELAARLKQLTPTYRLDHLVRPHPPRPPSRAPFHARRQQ